MPGRPLVARALEADLLHQLRVVRGAGDGHGPRVRRVGEQAAERDDQRRAAVLRERRDLAGERAPADVRLHAGADDEVAVDARQRRVEELRLRPGDVPRQPVAERDVRARHLEVHVVVGIDDREARGLEPGAQEGGRQGRRAARRRSSRGRRPRARANAGPASSPSAARTFRKLTSAGTVRAWLTRAAPPPGPRRARRQPAGAQSPTSSERGGDRPAHHVAAAPVAEPQERLGAAALEGLQHELLVGPLGDREPHLGRPRGLPPGRPIAAHAALAARRWGWCRRVSWPQERRTGAGAECRAEIRAVSRGSRADPGVRCHGLRYDRLPVSQIADLPLHRRLGLTDGELEPSSRPSGGRPTTSSSPSSRCSGRSTAATSTPPCCCGACRPTARACCRARARTRA